MQSNVIVSSMCTNSGSDKGILIYQDLDFIFWGLAITTMVSVKVTV